MKKYSFTMTKKEIMEFSVRSVLEQMRLQYARWLLILVICVLIIYSTPWLGIFLIATEFILIVIMMCTNYHMTKKIMYEKNRVMWIEDGILKIEEDSCISEIACSCVQTIRKTKKLLMLGKYQAKKRLAWYPMPFSVFSDDKEIAEFINLLQNSQFMTGTNQSLYTGSQFTYTGNQVLYDGNRDLNGQSQPMGGTENGAVVTENNVNEIFNFRFWIDERKWEGILIETTDIIRSRIMGGSHIGKMWILLVIALLIFICVCLFGSNAVILGIVFFFTLLLMVFIGNVSQNPAKLIRKQLKRGIVQNDTCGNWEISISETGVTLNSPKSGRSSMMWNKFSWLIESETAFYLFWEDKKHFVMILKESFGSFERAEAFKRMCAEKHITYAMKKDVKYVPGWVFSLLIAAIIIIYFLANAWYAIKDNRANMQEMYTENIQDFDNTLYNWEPEAFNLLDYPDYVPLDEQISVLGSYGFEISPRIAEQARNNMEEYDMMRIYIEGYPYTWLLMELGAPDHNDDWEVIGYSDKVFWFDFEGWDISTDYITILEGMMALAPQSAISSITNITENTDNADWDEGTGSIEVSLEWNGTEYSWDMEMQYDWIDEDILGILNALLEKTDEKERFYVTGDNGQGAIVFYCSDEWAKEFEKATGLKMETESME